MSGDADLDLPTANAIAAELDPPLRVKEVRRFQNVSADVFELRGAAGQAVILKVYADEPAWKLRKEAFVAPRFAPYAPVPVWLAIDERRAHLARRFAVMSRLPGASLRDRFGREGSASLYLQMGALLRRMHDAAMPRHGYLLEDDVAEPFETNGERMAVAFEAKFRDFRGWGGDAGLCSRMEGFVERHRAALEGGGSPVLCHNDFHPGNVLVDRAPDGGWRISGVVDFENAVAGDPLFDLAKALDYTAHECPSGRSPLAEGYGPLTRAGAAEALEAYRVFHKFELLNWFQAVGQSPFGPARSSLLSELAELTA